MLQPSHKQVYFKARELWQILKLEKKLRTAQNTKEWYLRISKDAVKGVSRPLTKNKPYYFLNGAH